MPIRRCSRRGPAGVLPLTYATASRARSTITGTTSVIMSVKVPFNALTPGEDAAAIRAAIDRVFASGWFVLGPEVEAFEQEFAAASRVPHAVGVGTGTDAITLILRALDIGPGDEVITPPLSAAYSALAVMMAGARPVFTDIDPERLTLDARHVEAAITP